MKKTILSVLIVLLLSFGFLGCGDQPCEVCGAATKAECICQAAGKQNLDKDAIADLEKMDFTTADVLAPVGTSFFGHEYADNALGKTIYIYWDNATEPMFEHYEKAWTARAVVQVGDHSVFSNASIQFLASGGPSAGGKFTYPDGTILFTGKK